MRPGQGDSAQQGAGKLQQAQLGVAGGAGHRGPVVSEKGLRGGGRRGQTPSPPGTERLWEQRVGRAESQTGEVAFMDS